MKMKIIVIIIAALIIWGIIVSSSGSKKNQQKDSGDNNSDAGTAAETGHKDHPGKVEEKAAVMEVGNKLIKPSNSNSLSL